MSLFTIPNVFVPGTRARAEEVNENFSSVADKIFSMETTVCKTLDGLEELTGKTAGLECLNEDGKTRLKGYLAPYSVVSCETGLHGAPAFASANGSVLKVSGAAVPLKYTDGDSIFTFDKEKTLDLFEGANGSYNAYLTPEGELKAFRAKYYSSCAPLDPYETKIGPVTKSTPPLGTITPIGSGAENYSQWQMFEGSGRAAKPAAASSSFGAIYSFKAPLSPDDYTAVVFCRIFSGTVTYTAVFEDNSSVQIFNKTSPWGLIRVDFTASKPIKSIKIECTNSNIYNRISGVDLISALRPEGEVWVNSNNGTQMLYTKNKWEKSSLTRVCSFKLLDGVIKDLVHAPLINSSLAVSAAEIYNSSMPDYKRAFSISNNVAYEAPCSGWLLFEFVINGYGYLEMTIDGSYMLFHQWYQGTDYGHPSQNLVPVSAGARYVINSTNYSGSFIPCKGVYL